MNKRFQPMSQVQGARPPVEVQVDLTNADQVKCLDCGSEHFIQVLRLYKVSALASPIGKELLAHQPAFICRTCNKELTLG
jgi:hypothetical protein